MTWHVSTGNRVVGLAPVAVTLCNPGHLQRQAGRCSLLPPTQANSTLTSLQKSDERAGHADRQPTLLLQQLCSPYPRRTRSSVDISNSLFLDHLSTQAGLCLRLLAQQHKPDESSKTTCQAAAQRCCSRCSLVATLSHHRQQRRSNGCCAGSGKEAQASINSRSLLPSSRHSHHQHLKTQHAAAVGRSHQTHQQTTALKGTHARH